MGHSCDMMNRFESNECNVSVDTFQPCTRLFLCRGIDFHIFVNTLIFIMKYRRLKQSSLHWMDGMSLCFNPKIARNAYFCAGHSVTYSSRLTCWT